jgi:hypothetical protein
MDLVKEICSYCSPKPSWEKAWRFQLNYDFNHRAGPDKYFPKTVKNAVIYLQMQVYTDEDTRWHSEHAQNFVTLYEGIHKRRRWEKDDVAR